MTAAHATHSEPQPTPNPPLPDGLCGVLGAGRLVTAVWRQKGGQQKLVQSDRADDESLHEALRVEPSRTLTSRVNSVRSSSKEVARAAG